MYHISINHNYIFLVHFISGINVYVLLMYVLL